MTTTPAYVTRMVKEAKDLRAKTYALKGFIGSDKFKALGEKKQDLMTAQLEAMVSYHDLLQERIKLEE